MSAEAPPPRHPNERRFEEFFIADSYVALKNYLYNYLERKRAINRVLRREPPGLVLEVGSGLSPIVTDSDEVIYSELSYRALRALKALQGRGRHVVADGTRLPFASAALDYVVCSEVLEHVEDDEAAIRELARVLRAGGLACITVPHRKCYFAADDRFVRHFRRYEIDEMKEKLSRAGLEFRMATKVLGPLEKVTMLTLVLFYSTFEKFTRPNVAEPANTRSIGAVFRAVVRPVFKWAHRIYAVLARIDAKAMPRALATVVLFEAEKPERPLPRRGEGRIQ